MLRVGLSDAYTSSYDLRSEISVPSSKRDAHERKETVQGVALGGADPAHARPQYGQGIMTQRDGGLVKSGRTEVNKVVTGHVNLSGHLTCSGIYLRISG